MIQTAPVPPPEATRSITRNAFVVVALLRAVQLVSLVAALSGVAQAEVAI
ncbi:hypothetical protein OHT57_06935 [Streptomyces sp. NBC_00285]|nr:hypothetical protein [Streptomyces sp. NBC_00285]